MCPAEVTICLPGCLVQKERTTEGAENTEGDFLLLRQHGFLCIPVGKLVLVLVLVLALVLVLVLADAVGLDVSSEASEGSSSVLEALVSVLFVGTTCSPTCRSKCIGWT